MKQLKKILSLMMVVAMLSTMLTACGSKEASAPAADSAPAASAETEAKTEEMPKYHFKFSLTHSNTDPIVPYVQQMIDEVEERTNGNITFELHPNGELGAINDVNEMIAQGAEIINYTGSDAFNATVPDLAILTSQYCLSNPSQMKAITDSDWYKGQIETLAAEGNVRMLSYNWFTGYRHFISTKPIETIDDMSGLQMRVADAASLIAFAKALGCAPVVTNWNETYSALSQGLVDCCECPLSSLWASSIHEVTDYLTLTGHLVSIGGMCMNEEIFASMPEEYQQIMLEACWNAGEAFGQHSLGIEEEFLGKFEEAGVTIKHLTDEELQGFIDKASAMYKDPALGFSEGLFEQIQEIIK